MKVKEIMTVRPLKYCSPETKLHIAAKIMKDYQCGILPVTDKEQKLLGIITDRDICLSLAQRQANFSEKVTIGQIMSTKVYTVYSTDDVSKALRKMRLNKTGRLPVIDE